jgi:hypothetical protein
MRTVHADETVARDDLLVSRLTCCTACGRRGTVREGYWVLDRPEAPFAVSYSLCARCRATQQPSLLLIDGILRARYAVQGEEEEPPGEQRPTS